MGVVVCYGSVRGRTIALIRLASSASPTETLTVAMSETLLYEQHDFPIFQNRMYDSPEAARGCPRGDIRLVQGAATGLITNHAFRPELMAYDPYYQNEQAVSPVFQRHLDQVADLVELHLGRESLIEVGCGKGYFLERLLARGIDIRGFDPAYEGHHPAIEPRAFDPQLGLTAKGLVLRHVLEHLQAPFDFLRQLRDANGGAGRIYIEVPCLEWIGQQRAWFDIFYEHVNYFRPSDFRRLFGEVVAAGHLFGGQYQYVVAELASLRPPVAAERDRFQLPDDFLSSLADHRPRSADSAQLPVGVWGGASKGVIFALLRERLGQPVDVVIDLNPAKQGLYLPATGLQVQAPEAGLAKLPPGSPLYIMNSIYADEIKAMSGGHYEYIGVEHDGI